MERVLVGRDEEILAAVRGGWADVDVVLGWARKKIPASNKQIAPYQAAVLAYYAHSYNQLDAQILEIGTALGYSACVMATAAPLASVVTLNPKGGEFEKAVRNLRIRANVDVLQKASQEFWADSPKETAYDMVFVDGDHSYNMVLHDAQFFNRLKVGGLIIFHDYSPDGSARPSNGCYEALNCLQALHRPADVLVIGTDDVGMLGWIRREGEEWLVTSG